MRPDDHEYSSEEVSQIIRIALRKANGEEQRTVPHAELLTIAKDLGLSESDLDGALDELGEIRDQANQGVIAMQEVRLHVVCYLAGVVALFLINAIVSPEYWWAALPMVAYAPVVFVHWYLARQNPVLALRMVREDGDETEVSSFRPATREAD